MTHSRRVSVTGLGYVGLPVAVAFARSGVATVGFDTGVARVEALRRGIDRTGEIDPADLASPLLTFSTDPAALKAADFHIVTVPTPIDAASRPDLGPLRAASTSIARALKKGDIVVFESTVYPGVTEDECIPVLERDSGLRWKTDFNVGYSPERINPGDRVRRFDTILKIVSADTPETLEVVDAVYRSVVTAGTFRAPSIKVAEAAKVVENTQRDINIALINELSLIFDRMGVDTRDVLAAAGTKWNFLPFRPGLVGGHCVGVDPFYLTHLAESVGYHARVILSGRHVNDGMGTHVAERVVRELARGGWERKPSVTILGATFKENVPDVRNTRVADVVWGLRAFGIEPRLHDPLAAAADIEAECGLAPTPLDALPPADAIVLAVAHTTYVEGGWGLIGRLLKPGGGFVADVPAFLDRATTPPGVTLWRL